jgi:hypothetical protein
MAGAVEGLAPACAGRAITLLGIAVDAIDVLQVVDLGRELGALVELVAAT